MFIACLFFLPGAYTSLLVVPAEYSTERREYAVTTPGAYSKYRLHFTDDNDTRTAIETISMGHLEFLGCK